MTVVLPVFTIVLPGPCTCVVFTDGTGALVFKYMLLVKDVEALCAGHTHVFWMMGNTAHMARHHFSTICQIIGVSTIVTCGSILPSHSFGHSHKFVNYVSPHEMGRHNCFKLCCLSVHLSVRPFVLLSRFRVRSTCISFEPLVGFTNNFAQMSNLIRRCAVPMFDQGQGHNLRLNIV